MKTNSTGLRLTIKLLIDRSTEKKKTIQKLEKKDTHIFQIYIKRRQSFCEDLLRVITKDFESDLL